MKALYATAEQVGLPIVSADNAARIMAVLYVHGNNEDFVYSPKFNAEREYIQKRFCINGSETPDYGFLLLLKEYVKELKHYERLHKGNPIPEWASIMFRDRYGIELK